MIIEKDYTKAQENPLIRQNFLNKIDLENAHHYVDKVNYIDNPNELSTIGNENRLVVGEAIMETTGKASGFFLRPFINLKRFKFTKPTIEVYSQAFSSHYHPQLDDFLSSLIDHEGEHARRECEVFFKIY